MKVAILGNLANVGFQFCQYLPKAGIEADLLLNSDSVEAWRHFNAGAALEDQAHVRVFRYGRVDELVRKVRTLHEYDLALSVCLGGMWMLPFLGKPYVSYATGSDLRELAAGRAEGGQRIRAAQARRMFRKARLTFVSPDREQLKVAERLRLEPRVAWRQFVDTEYWRPVPARSSHHLRIVHPSNLLWRARFEGQSSKGNDLLFRGFRSFLDRGGTGTLVYLERGQDVAATQELIAELRLTEHVEVAGTDLDRRQLRALIEGADVLADQFRIGIYGLTALEGMACGKTVLTYAETEMLTLAYGPDPSQHPPLENVASADEIADSLLRLQDPIYRRLQGERSRAWIEAVHDPHKLAEWYAAHLRSVLK